jgi:hypothetical protein
VDGGFDGEEHQDSHCEVFELPAVHIVGICGSIRNGSFTKKALQIALEGASQSRCRVTLVDLNDWKLPMCDGRYAPVLIF